MISLDQVLLLEQKVESAVAKIQQLEAENDALRNKCSELTNALSAKTEQLASFEKEQKAIESGIIKTIDRLNSIENSVLKAAGSTSAVNTATAPKPAAPVPPVPPIPPVPPKPAEPQEPLVPPAPQAPQEPEASETPETPVVSNEMNFDSMETVEEPEAEETLEAEPPVEEIEEEIAQADPDYIDEPVDDNGEAAEGESTDNLGFDIF